LHHTLRGEARRREGNGPSLIKTSVLTAEERAAWSSALDAYAPFGRRDLLFDAELVRINNTLTLLTDDAPLDRTELQSPAKRALTIAAPIYRAHFWASQQQLNDRWIAAVKPIIAEHGAALAAALARVYRGEWPDQP